MRIEKKYRDDARKQLDVIAEKMQTKEKELSEIENSIFEKKRDSEAESIFKSYEKLCSDVKKHTDEFKLERFHKLCEKAVNVAFLMEANIIAETDNNMIGRISFESDWALVSNTTDGSIKEIISELFMIATDVIISFRSGLFHIELMYELYSISDEEVK